MINNIYQKVFGTNVRCFDPQRDNYSIILNLMNTSVKDMIGSYIDSTCYEEITMDFSAAPTLDEIEEKLYQSVSIQQSRYNGVNYILIYEYTGTDHSDIISGILCQLAKSTLVKSGDRVVLVAVLPEDKNASVQFIKDLESRQIPLDVMAYFLVRDKYKENYINSAFCGIMTLYRDKEVYQQLDRNIAHVKRYVDQGKNNLGEGGQEMLKLRPELLWSSLYVYNQNDKMTFLQEYLHGLYSNCQTYKDVQCNEVCEAYFSQILGVFNKRVWINRLEQAIKFIPRIAPHEPSLDQSLENYFNQIYGSCAVDVVELTLQVNLQKRYTFSKQTVVEAADALFEHAKEYYSNSLIDEVVEHLDKYISDYLSKAIAGKYEVVRRFIQNDGDVASDMSRYIELYMEYCDEIYQRTFWTEVKNYITANTELYNQQSEEVSRLTQSLETAKRKLFVLPSAHENKKYPKYSLARLLNCVNDTEICNTINAAYQSYGKDGEDADEQKETVEHIRYPSIFPKLNLFFQDYQYTPKSDWSNSMLICQRIGQYYMFGE